MQKLKIFEIYVTSVVLIKFHGIICLKKCIYFVPSMDKTDVQEKTIIWVDNLRVGLYCKSC